MFSHLGKTLFFYKAVSLLGYALKHLTIQHRYFALQVILNALASIAEQCLEHAIHCLHKNVEFHRSNWLLHTVDAPTTLTEYKPRSDHPLVQAM